MLLDLANLVLTTTWYNFSSQFYQETEGVVIRGIASSATTEIYSQTLIQNAVSMTLYPPTL